MSAPPQELGPNHAQAIRIEKLRATRRENPERFMEFISFINVWVTPKFLPMQRPESEESF